MSSVCVECGGARPWPPHSPRVRVHTPIRNRCRPDRPETTAPQPDAPCADHLAGALTPADPEPLGNNRRLLQCDDGTWQAFGGPYPSSDRWLTTGPELVVHGQGRRNPEAAAGTWTGTPQTTEAHCSAEVVDVVAAPVKTSGPMTSAADPGQPLTLRDQRSHVHGEAQRLLPLGA